MGDLLLRHSTDGDVEGILDVARRSHLAGTGLEAHWTTESMRRMRNLPGRDAGADFPVVVRGEAVVAWAGIFANPPYTEIFVDLHVDPRLGDDDAATATALLVAHAAARGRAVGPDAPAGAERTLALETLESDARLLEDLEALGFVRDRYEYEMAIDLGDTVPEAPTWPDDVVVSPMGGPEDTEVVTAVLAESFADHPGNPPFSADVLRRVLGQEDHVVAASAVVRDAEGPVGVVESRRRPGAGYVWVLGVVPRARRRGLGSRLLQHAFHAFASAGTPLVLLDVDGANDSGALAVYAEAGMTARTTKVVLTRLLAQD